MSVTMSIAYAFPFPKPYPQLAKMVIRTCSCKGGEVLNGGHFGSTRRGVGSTGDQCTHTHTLTQV